MRGKNFCCLNRYSVFLSVLNELTSRPQHIITVSKQHVRAPRPFLDFPLRRVQSSAAPLAKTFRQLISPHFRIHSADCE